VADLRPSAPGRAWHGAELLPELLDFEGAIQLAHALQSAPRAARATMVPATAVDRARRQLAAAEREASQPLRDPHTGGSLIPAERIAQLLERAGLPTSRRRTAIASAARELFTPVETRALERIATVRRLLAQVRRELGPIIAASGSAAARLEQIDAVLVVATAARSEALVARAFAAVGAAFASELERAIRELPRAIDLELPVTAWAGEDGLVSAHVARCEALCVAAFVHERARVDMLVRHTLGERLA
jgi:hypothetical protein